jgi:intracellular septation protein
MHVVTLALIAILGGATLLLQDKAFFMWKPTAVNWAFALGFFVSQIIGDKPLVERMMSHAIEAPRQVWYRLNLSWIGFFILMGFANLYVANFYFQAEAVLFEAAGHAVDLETCQQMYQGQLLELCMHAREVENDWVNFKLFGMLGLTILFVIGQAVYLAKHMKQQPETATQKEQNNEV